jgi:hypothetical protein
MQIQLLEQRADVAGRLGQGPVVLLLARVAVTAQAHRGSLFGPLIIGPVDTAEHTTTIVRACGRRLDERGDQKLMN